MLASQVSASGLQVQTSGKLVDMVSIVDPLFWFNRLYKPDPKR